MPNKSGFVTLLGRPNVGKSTLMNGLVGQKIAITSSKPQTTRNLIQAILTRDEAQIIFIDTPGIHKAKNRLGEYMVNIAHQSMGDIDIILWLVEPADFIGPAERHIIEQLKKVRVPVFLVINKIDMVKKDDLYKVIETYRNEMDFAEIIPVSAREKQNTEKLVSCIVDYLPEGAPYYDEDAITDQPERTLVAELIREKALHALDDEVPHGIAVVIESMKKKGKIYEIHATIICERDSHKRIIIGKSGEKLKKIGTNARFEIEQLLRKKVNLQLWVKVKKDWRDSEHMLKDIGYRPYYDE